MIDRYDPKDPLEVNIFSMDFTSLVSGLAISACVVDVLRSDGAVEDTSAMVSGVCDLSDKPIIKQKIAGGTHGVEYLIRFKATTSTEVIVASGLLLVKNGA